jgi:hypothetical protein
MNNLLRSRISQHPSYYDDEKKVDIITAAMNTAEVKYGNIARFFPDGIYEHNDSYYAMFPILPNTLLWDVPDDDPLGQRDPDDPLGEINATDLIDAADQIYEHDAAEKRKIMSNGSNIEANVGIVTNQYITNQYITTKLIPPHTAFKLDNSFLSPSIQPIYKSVLGLITGEARWEIKSQTVAAYPPQTLYQHIMIQINDVRVTFHFNYDNEAISFEYLAQIGDFRTTYPLPFMFGNPNSIVEFRYEPVVFTDDKWPYKKNVYVVFCVSSHTFLTNVYQTKVLPQYYIENVCYKNRDELAAYGHQHQGVYQFEYVNGSVHASFRHFPSHNKL